MIYGKKTASDWHLLVLFWRLINQKPCSDIALDTWVFRVIISHFPCVYQQASQGVFKKSGII